MTLTTATENDGYGKRWEYRVLSEIDTCPDDGNSGKRLLSICRVIYCWRPVTWPNPTDDDIDHIDDDIGPLGNTAEQLMVDLGRMQAAVDKPVLIRAEWIDYIIKTVRISPNQDGDDDRKL